MSTQPHSLSNSLQDNILTVVCFHDDLARLVRSTVEVSLFTSRTYRVIIERAYAYVDRFGKAPQEHIADELEDILAADNEDAELTANVLEAAKELSGSINPEYVRQQIERFVRQQSLKVGIVRAHELIQEGDLDTAEVVLDAAVKKRAMVFDPGLSLTQVVRTLLHKEEDREPIATGIKSFDRLGLGPARKELHLFIAPPKRGKSWWLTHCAKRALMQRWRGVYVTLELADKFVGRRQLMSQFAMTSREGVELLLTEFERDAEGQLSGLTRRRSERPSLAKPEVLRTLVGKLEALRLEKRFLIKEFPTGSLTVSGLAAYLDGVDRAFGWSPDFVVLDYADLMKLRADNYRQDLGRLYVELRGLAVERNFALITASQSNREGAGSRLITDVHAAEDYSKVATSDCVITFNQTPLERGQGLARLFVASGRVEADRFAVIVSQSYASGQFALDSQMMTEDYWTMAHGEEERDGGH